MDAIDLNDYVAGGYYIGAYTSRPNNKESHLPERIISISDCRGDILRVSSLNRYLDQQSDYLTRQGLLKSNQDTARIWYDKNWRKDISFPDGFYELATAQQFASEFMQTREDHFIVGVGLQKSFSKEFVEENDILTAKFVSDEEFKERQLKRDEPFGVNKMIRQQKSLEKGGHVLGFELVTYLTGFGCSYLCTVDQFQMIEEFNAYPNKYGLIDNFEIATKVRHWRGSDEDYFPWLIVQYPIT